MQAPICNNNQLTRGDDGYIKSIITTNWIDYDNGIDLFITKMIVLTKNWIVVFGLQYVTAII